MRTSCLNASKDTGILNQTSKRFNSRPYNLRRRKRNYSSHQQSLSPCLEEELKMNRLGANSLNGSPERFTQSTLEVMDGSYGNRSLMPPGPPTSPVPSPPLLHHVACDRGHSIEDCQIDSSGSLTAAKSPIVLCNRFRKRRNAICGNSALGHGLKEFFASYVVSNLTDSMTSSLTLKSENSLNASVDSQSCLIDNESVYHS